MVIFAVARTGGTDSEGILIIGKNYRQNVADTVEEYLSLCVSFF